MGHPVAATPRRQHPAGGAFRHEVILHGDGAEGFVSQTAPVIEDALDSGAPVLVAVSEKRAERLREALGAAAAAVGFIDMQKLGVNPARIIPAWRQFLNERAIPGTEPLGAGAGGCCARMTSTGWRMR
jgi:hypothetical protein